MLRWKKEGKTLSYKYENVVPGFAMPIRVLINGKPVSITPTESMLGKGVQEDIKTVEVDRNYYVESKEL